MSYKACERVYCAKARFKKTRVFKSRQKNAVSVEAWMDADRLFHTAGPAWTSAEHCDSCCADSQNLLNLGQKFASFTRHLSLQYIQLNLSTVPPVPKLRMDDKVFYKLDYYF